ncbi:hypothetical protein CBS470a_010720 [Colletotrichum nupharicola]|nr:hypothetical protein CBS470a_010720 [Colletotrichum nupharicola]
MIGTGVYSTPSAILKGTGSFSFSNGVGAVKLLTLVFIAITGLVVLGGHTKVPEPHANFENSFDGQATAYGLTNALYRIIFSYAGFENAFNVVNEVKNPVKQIRKYGCISLGIVTILYILANIAYFAAVPKADLAAAEQIAASLFFTNVFGSSGAVRGLNFLIALSSFGNLLTVLIGSSRMLRECGRTCISLSCLGIPPEGGVFAGDVIFWYATYVVAGIGILLGCGVYYWLWIYVVPKARGYRIMQHLLELADGAQSHKLVKVPVGDLAEWDATHDHVGRLLQQVLSVPGSEEEKKPVAV